MAMVNLHTHSYSARADLLEIVNQYPHEFDKTIPNYSIGIHPWYIQQDRLEKDFEILESKLQTTECLAVGECGLDKRIEVPLALQIELFEQQLRLAEKYQKPVIIHCVAAFQELIACTNKLKVTVPVVIHGFSKKLQLANDLLSHGFYLSFGKYLLRNPELESVFTAVPNNRIFLETDSVQEDITEVYSLAARYKGITDVEMEQIIEKNYNMVFDTKLK